MPIGPMVVKKDNESLNSVLKRFRRECSKAGIKNELKKRRFYKPPSELKNITLSREKRRNIKNRIRVSRQEEHIKTRKRRG